MQLILLLFIICFHLFVGSPTSNSLALANALSAYILSSHVPYRNRQWASQQLLKCISSKIQSSLRTSIDQINFADLSNSLPPCTTSALEGHDNRVAVLAWHDNTKTLASSGYDGTIRIWTLNSTEQLCLERTLIFHKNTEVYGRELQGKLIGHLKWSPESDYIAAAMENIINVWYLKGVNVGGEEGYGGWFIEDFQEFVTAMTWPKHKEIANTTKNYLIVGKIDGSVSLVIVDKSHKEVEHLVNCSLSFGKFSDHTS